MIREYINEFSKKLVYRSLKNISNGTLSIIDGNQSINLDDDDTLNAEIIVNNPRFYTEILLGASIGASEA